MNNKPRILCVDDDLTILKTLEMLLIPNGYEIVKAMGGEEALKKLQEEVIDLVISDVKMPGMDGFELCRRIKGDAQFQNIPVVLITGLAAKEDRVKGIEAGAEDFIYKPFDAGEVLARVRMLLKAKAIQERRIGELLIELGFINKEQLEQALLLAKEQKIKVGEALNSMGALDKDRIYWALSTQLNMNYIELSLEMIDPEIVLQFPLETLEKLLCLPLYETATEINFAVADPTDYKIVKEIKSLRPFKSVQLHLALPEKISKILNYLKESHFAHWKAKKELSAEQEGSFFSLEGGQKSSFTSQWQDLISFFLSMKASQVCWLTKNPEKAQLLTSKEGTLEIVQSYSPETYYFIKEQLDLTSFASKGMLKGLSFANLQSGSLRGVFRLHQIPTLAGEFIQVNRIQDFSKDEFLSQNAQIPGLIADLENYIHLHHLLLLGGKESLFLKQCFYYLNSLMREKSDLTLPPPIFVEEEFEMYFPQAVQLLNDQKGLINILDSFKSLLPQVLFVEFKSPVFLEDKEILSKILASNFRHICLYHPFPSAVVMEEAKGEMDLWLEVGFKAVFFQPYQFIFV